MKKDRTWWWVGGIIVLIIVLVVIGKLTSSSGAKGAASTTIADPSSLPGIQTGTTTPWAVELQNLRARLAADNLPALAAEGTVLHIHQHLDIFIHGQHVTIPAGVGIYEAAQFISPIHVHDLTGIIHVESPTPGTFTLGQFFDIWGVKFTNDCIGGYCNDGTNTLKMYVNGDEYTGDFRTLELKAHDEIAITYGTDAEKPAQIPSSYAFPLGY
ncbi:MAG TPA: hypothetical protein VHF05_02100 [Candidatus Paceibacterota bacterium]|jgi:hypothetical protein|nr:hypothetical protein [Candidatus Paceibacterota bacterium]